MWGTTGIGYNVAPCASGSGANAALNSWTVVLNPASANKLKDCGIMMLDSPEDLIPSMLPVFGAKADSKRWDDLTLVTDALYKVRGSVRKFHASEYIQALANGDICVAVGYSGDVMQAKRRAEEAKNGIEIAYVVPKEGALMWFDTFAIPKDAAHPAEALAFIDYMLRPEVAAAKHQLRGLCQRQPRGEEVFVKPEILSNPGHLPDEATMQRLAINTAWDDRTQRYVTRLWTRFAPGGERGRPGGDRAPGRWALSSSGLPAPCRRSRRASSSPACAARCSSKPIFLVAGIVQLVGELLARRQAGIQADQLHQVDDGMAPIELLRSSRRGW